MLDMIEFVNGKPNFINKLQDIKYNDSNSSMQRYSSIEKPKVVKKSLDSSLSEFKNKGIKSYRNDLLHQSVDTSIGYKKL